MADKKEGPQAPKQISVELSPEKAEGTYANLAIISHSPAEFIFDFTRLLPGLPKAKVQSRVIMTPQHAKMFMRAMNENIAKYEQQYGEIPTDRQDNPFAGFKEPPKIN